MRGMAPGEKDAPWRHRAETVIRGGSPVLRILP
jgi:hypothetical protein